MRKLIVITVASLSLIGLAGCSSSDVEKVVTENAQEQVETVKSASAVEVQAAVQNANVEVNMYRNMFPNATDFSQFEIQNPSNKVSVQVSGTPSAYVITASNTDGYTYSFDSSTGQYK